MDEFKPDLRAFWEYLRQNPHLALSGALFFGGILGLAFGAPQSQARFLVLVRHFSADG
ncbi:hypothetical protein [Paraburkholderia jirisanensis]